MPNYRFVLIAAWSMLVVVSSNVQAGVALQSFTVTPSTPPEALSTNLFTNIGAQSAPSTGHGPGATAVWPVTVNLALLTTLPSSVVLNFPDRAAVTLTRLRSEPRGSSAFLWTGRGGDCSALLRAAQMGFRGSISCLNAPYGVTPSSNGLQLTRYDQAVQPAEWEPSPGSTVPAAAPAAPVASSPNQVPDQSVDILVLYNEDVRQAYDGSGTAKTQTILAMHDAVDQVQLVMDNSTTLGQPVIAQVNFVVAKEVSRATTSNLSADLLWLRTDPVPTGLRDYWAADVVVYVTGDVGNPLQGQANIPGYQLPSPGPNFAPYAQAAVVSTYASSDGYYVFAHEFAHTLGANHNPDQQPSNPTPVEPWAFGNWALDPEPPHHGNRTIMSYQVSPSCVTYCTRILNYSNPQVSVDWFQTGTGNRNNAAVIQEVAPVTAQYRATLGRIFADGFE